MPQPSVLASLPEDLRGRDAVFAAPEFAARQDRLRHVTRAMGAQALVLLGPENIFWATGRQTAGYFAFQALVLPLDADPVLLVRRLELAGAVNSTWLADIRVYEDGQDPFAALAAILEAVPGRIALEQSGWFVTPVQMAALLSRVGADRVIDGSGLAESLRAVKSDAELAAIRQAAGYAQAGLRAGIAACGAGVSENTVTARMMAAAIEAGSEAMAMEPLVSSGPRSGVPHATWRRRVMGPGDGVFLELAASHDRYHSALMRSVWIGPPPARAQAMMDVAEAALDAALAAIRPGEPCSAPHEAAQKVIDAEGLTDAFRKRIGYSMGAAFAPDWGEGAILSLFTGVARALEPGMVFHLPATLRAYGVWTVGVSETVIVTENGCDVLSDLPRQMTLR